MFTTNLQVNRVETKPAEVTEKRTILTTETKQTVPKVTVGNAQIPLPPKIIQKEWKCVLCNVTFQSENTLVSHLQSRKHKDMGETTKAEKSQPKVITAYVVKKSNQHTEGEPQSSANNQSVPPKVVFSYAQKQSYEVGKQAEWTNGWEPTVVRHDMSKGIRKINNIAVASSSSIKTTMAPIVKPKDYSLCCHICNVRCGSKIDMESHLKGRRHLTQLQLLNS